MNLKNYFELNTVGEVQRVFDVFLCWSFFFQVCDKKKTESFSRIFPLFNFNFILNFFNWKILLFKSSTSFLKGKKKQVLVKFNHIKVNENYNKSLKVRKLKIEKRLILITFKIIYSHELWSMMIWYILHQICN